MGDSETSVLYIYIDDRALILVKPVSCWGGSAKKKKERRKVTNGSKMVKWETRKLFPRFIIIKKKKKSMLTYFLV